MREAVRIIARSPNRGRAPAARGLAAFDDISLDSYLGIAILGKMGDDQHEPNRRQPFVKLFYDLDYVRSGHAFETTRKSQWIIDSLRREPMAEVEVLAPEKETGDTRKSKVGWRGQNELTKYPYLVIARDRKE